MLYVVSYMYVSRITFYVLISNNHEYKLKTNTNLRFSTSQLEKELQFEKFRILQ